MLQLRCVQIVELARPNMGDAAFKAFLGGKLAELASFAEKARDSLRLVVSERPYKDTLSQVRWWGTRRSGTYNGTG